MTTINFFNFVCFEITLQLKPIFRNHTNMWHVYVEKNDLNNDKESVLTNYSEHYLKRTVRDLPSDEVLFTVKFYDRSVFIEAC